MINGAQTFVNASQLNDAFNNAKAMRKQAKQTLTDAIRNTFDAWMAKTLSLPGVDEVIVYSEIQYREDGDMATAYLNRKEIPQTAERKEADDFFMYWLGANLTVKRMVKWFGDDVKEKTDSAMLVYSRSGHSFLTGDKAYAKREQLLDEAA